MTAVQTAAALRLSQQADYVAVVLLTPVPFLVGQAPPPPAPAVWWVPLTVAQRYQLAGLAL